MLGKIPVPGHPTNLDNSRQRPIAPAVCAGGGRLATFFSYLSFLFPFCLSGRRPDID